MDYSAQLPVEIFLKIISYLDGDEIFPCLGVCRRWRNLLNFNEFWKRLCEKARIFDSITTPRGPTPLCSWAEAYFRYRIIPMENWRKGEYKSLYLDIIESDLYCDAWDGQYAAVYYYTLGKVYLYAIYEDIQIKQIIKVPLPKKEDYFNASISFNVPYLVVTRFNVALIYKKNNKVYLPLKYVSVSDTFDFGLKLSERKTHLHTEIAWGHVWMRANCVSDLFITDLKDFSKKFFTGKPHLAFNDNVKLVIAWTKSSVRVASVSGDILLTLNKNKVRSIDYNSKILVLQVENQVEVINIKTGTTIYTIQAREKVECALGNSLILLEGDRTSTLSSFSWQNGTKNWTLKGLLGRSFQIRFVGSRYLFIVPAFCKNCYCLVDWNGKYIREDSLPDFFKELPGPVFSETLPFFVVTNLSRFDIMSFV